MSSVGVTIQCIYCGRDMEIEVEIPGGVPEDEVELEIRMPCPECVPGSSAPGQPPEAISPDDARMC